MTTCSNCGTAEASYLCALVSDYRCSYCATLARRPEEYKPLKPAAAPREFTIEWPGWNPTGGAYRWTSNNYGGPPSTAWSKAAGPYVASVGDNVRVVTNCEPLIYGRPNNGAYVGDTGRVKIVEPVDPGVIVMSKKPLPAETMYYIIEKGNGQGFNGWFVVEKMP